MNPELVKTQRFAGQYVAVLPNPIASIRPFQSARRNSALLAGRVLVKVPASQNDGQRGDAQVRVHANGQLSGRDYPVIQECEGFDGFPYAT